MVTLRRVIVEPDKGEKFVGPLKARDEKATRRVDLPDELVAVLEDHLKQFVGTQPTAWLFEDPDKGLLARSQFRLLLDKAKEVTGLDDVTFHVLRHTGATWFAEEGATVREVMERLGHRSERMAMRYQHAATAVSYTHLDVYKRQHGGRVHVDRGRTAQSGGCLLQRRPLLRGG